MKTSILAALAAFFVTPAFAQTCFPEPELRAQLQEKGFELRATGQAGPNGQIPVETYVDGQNQFATFVRPQEGVMCVVVSGKGFSTYAAKPNA